MWKEEKKHMCCSDVPTQILHLNHLWVGRIVWFWENVMNVCVCVCVCKNIQELLLWTRTKDSFQKSPLHYFLLNRKDFFIPPYKQNWFHFNVSFLTAVSPVKSGRNHNRSSAHSLFYVNRVCCNVKLCETWLKRLLTTPKDKNHMAPVS